MQKKDAISELVQNKPQRPYAFLRDYFGRLEAISAARSNSIDSNGSNISMIILQSNATQKRLPFNVTEIGTRYLYDLIVMDASEWHFTGCQLLKSKKIGLKIPRLSN